MYVVLSHSDIHQTSSQRFRTRCCLLLSPPPSLTPYCGRTVYTVFVLRTHRSTSSIWCGRKRWQLVEVLFSLFLYNLVLNLLHSPSWNTFGKPWGRLDLPLLFCDSCDSSRYRELVTRASSTTLSILYCPLYHGFSLRDFRSQMTRSEKGRRLSTILIESLFTFD